MAGSTTRRAPTWLGQDGGKSFVAATGSARSTGAGKYLRQLGDFGGSIVDGAQGSLAGGHYHCGAFFIAARRLRSVPQNNGSPQTGTMGHANCAAIVVVFADQPAPLPRRPKTQRLDSQSSDPALGPNPADFDRFRLPGTI